MSRREEFVDKVNTIHKNKYDYTLMDYSGIKDIIKVICPNHGVFNIKAFSHLHNKIGCPLCKEESLVKTKTEEINEFLKGSKYQIEKLTKYPIRTKDKLNCSCKVHGEYKTTLHILKNTTTKGCPKCKSLDEFENFQNKAKNIHKDNYEYLPEDYVCSRTLMRIKCKKHNLVFKQRPSAHLQGQGCPSCGKESFINTVTWTNEDFITECRRIHSEKFSYSNTKYTSSKEDVIVTCDVHGDISVNPRSFLRHGCSKCNEESRQKSRAEIFLTNFKSIKRYNHITVDIEKYRNNKSRLDCFCNIHKQKFTSNANCLLHEGNNVGCYLCNGLSMGRWNLKSILKIPNLHELQGYFYIGVVDKIEGFKIGITQDLNSRACHYRQDFKKNNLDLNFTYIHSCKMSYLKTFLVEKIVKTLLKCDSVKHSYDFGGKTEFYNPSNNLIDLVNIVVLKVNTVELNHSCDYFHIKDIVSNIVKELT